MGEKEIKEQTENEEENQEGAAVFLRKVEVIICNDGDNNENEESNGASDSSNSG